MAEKSETVTFHRLTCDACGEASNGGHDDDTYVTPEDAREAAASGGWLQVPAPGARPADICAGCKDRHASACARCARPRGHTATGYTWCGCTADMKDQLRATRAAATWDLATPVARLIGADPAQVTFTGDGGFKATSKDRAVSVSVTPTFHGTPEAPLTWELHIVDRDGRRGAVTYVPDGPVTAAGLNAALRSDPVTGERVALILDRATA